MCRLEAGLDWNYWWEFVPALCNSSYCLYIQGRCWDWTLNSTRCVCCVCAPVWQRSRYVSALVSVYASTGCDCAAFQLCCSCGAPEPSQKIHRAYIIAGARCSNHAKSRLCHITQLCVNSWDLHTFNRWVLTDNRVCSHSTMHKHPVEFQGNAESDAVSDSKSDVEQDRVMFSVRMGRSIMNVLRRYYERLNL